MGFTPTEQGAIASRSGRETILATWVSLSCKGMDTLSNRKSPTLTCGFNSTLPKPMKQRWNVSWNRIWLDGDERIDTSSCDAVRWIQSSIPITLSMDSTKQSSFYDSMCVIVGYGAISVYRFQVLRSSSRLWNEYSSHSVMESLFSFPDPLLPGNSDVEKRAILWENWRSLKWTSLISMLACQSKVMCFFSICIHMTWLIRMVNGSRTP